MEEPMQQLLLKKDKDELNRIAEDLHHINVKLKFSISNLSLTNYIICLLFHLINILFKKIKYFI